MKPYFQQWLLYWYWHLFSSHRLLQRKRVQQDDLTGGPNGGACLKEGRESGPLEASLLDKTWYSGPMCKKCWWMPSNLTRCSAIWIQCFCRLLSFCPLMKKHPIFLIIYSEIDMKMMKKQWTCFNNNHHDKELLDHVFIN